MNNTINVKLNQVKINKKSIKKSIKILLKLEF